MQTNKQFKLSALNQVDIENLSLEQRQFAQEQFHLIYAEEMSKLSMELTHKQKIIQNLNTLDQQEQKNLKEQYRKLKSKMALIEEKRSKRLEDKVKQFKQKDQRWYHKLKQIQSKFKQQNRQAIEKAKKYRQESEHFWKDKEKKTMEKSRTHIFNTNTKSRHDVGRSLDESAINQSHSNRGRRFQILNQQYGNYTLQQDQGRPDNDILDIQINLHKERSQNLQKRKEQIVFQKALQKMQKINKKRQYIHKKYDVKPREPTIPRRVDRSHRQFRKKKIVMRHSQSNQEHNTDHNSKEPLQKLIKDHLQSKQKLQQQQFMHRGQIMENNAQKSRKQKIIKIIKSRVHEIKVQSLRKQGSKKNIPV